MSKIIQLHGFTTGADYQRIEPLVNSYTARDRKDPFEPGPQHAIELKYDDPHRFGKQYYTIYKTAQKIKLFKGRKADVIG